ncbi:hypothetical protein [Coraliomargarita akajimensis]|uniref:PEP-CTERM protein-sorting domain-containing protein n=1 Tax=Coraliomargarita akajimensis (strain DSM 45221 / IAM 15411 / JCM 23193 / KCTC 12865 / 04OKA010-24) TaxID=583355 RepID=D5ER28_CORAD|nr:hypothetical protein [Coraliomargarita akajimensis]ADE54021.1 hypothetical protein Caka_0999 [Coraliomargarita akajimensis DSM 45221]
MKKHLTLLSLIFSTVCAWGNISINWTMPDLSDEIYQQGGTALLPANSVWQLIWTPDNAISAFDATDPFNPHSSEILLEELRNADAGYIFGQGGSYDGTNFGVGEDGLVGGYVYTRVFDYTGDTSSFNLVDLDGMYYAESEVAGALQKTDAPTFGPATLHVPFDGANSVDQQFVVPESSAYALILGLVGLSFGVCRRSRR